MVSRRAAAPGVAIVLVAFATLTELSHVASAQDTGPCPNGCSGHGLCHLTECTCFDGWIGGDCSLRQCPFDVAWNDVATGEDEAHNIAECSNRGSCDRETGQCVCDVGFHGRACQMSTCPNDCWGRGRCVDIRYNALYKDPGTGTVYPYDSVWDSEKVYGCMCDQGFTGYDCSLRECPRGDDPMTTGQLDEVQVFRCKGTSGFFTLTFSGFTSEPIPVTTVLADFETILEAVPGVGDVTVTFSVTGSQICHDSSTNQIVTVTFNERFGDVPNLISQSTTIEDCMDATASQYDMCGGTGLTGICTCYTNFVTSDGRGNEGDRGDCGYESAEVQACPGLIACSGHGTCSQSPEFRCTCSLGWDSGDCSVRTCAKGKSWFDHPVSANRAHQLQECSNMGICDRVTGVCVCHTGFTGAACDQMQCPGSPTECSGNGQCLFMSQLANKATDNGDLAATTYGQTPNDPYRWDYDMIKGCLCDEGYEGHDCSLMSCPTGDDPETLGQDFETQVLRCQANGGSFRLYFRQHQTELIPHNADEAALRAALSAIDSITDVEVTFSSGTSFCTDDASNVASIVFTQELGDVPDLTAFISSFDADLAHGTNPEIAIATNGASIDSVQSVRGTKENVVCSARGVCNHETGTCECFQGFASSNGNGSSGDRGDCGWKVPWTTTTTED
ncbi:Multiple epidermal growth factor-like domains protein 10 [Hondaea fermentalgiana]|uniref:Multiple epidermal growth factor-like domains protein 10 n=1 Tax=Hondaea fermentalgiana TaxID=2315210 RepID=A0A2R5GRS9_9STRA|nr:Multiple epidermal growth factor-like domains protein 10 [Hondaea fermentalgiana]|eukprot:GBG30584.1 Multiple epidermal growth factor-like domains protein 10 [Hondaea fermentalgiana]